MKLYNNKYEDSYQEIALQLAMFSATSASLQHQHLRIYCYDSVMCLSKPSLWHPILIYHPRSGIDVFSPSEINYKINIMPQSRMNHKVIKLHPQLGLTILRRS